MGLNHPEDLEAWHRWQEGQRPAAQVRAGIRRALRQPVADQSVTMSSRGAAPFDAVFVLDSLSPTSLLAVLEPALHTNGPVAVLAPADPSALLLGEGWTHAQATRVELDASVESAGVVVSAGHYLPLGGVAWRAAMRRAVPYLVVQHGLLTPIAPPLPSGALLAAWSDEDAAFWMSGRKDVEHVTVGSQLLWGAAQRPARLADDRPVFLGQLHGAELPRLGLARASREFCRPMDATYRPHPAEKDKLSRLQHRLWERAGIEIDRSGQPLSELDRPVASVFSTGVLEAAARGLPAWVHYDGPPAWLSEFWERYGMSRWGRDHHPTQPRGIPEAEPARRIAALIEEMAST